MLANTTHTSSMFDEANFDSLIDDHDEFDHALHSPKNSISPRNLLGGHLSLSNSNHGNSINSNSNSNSNDVGSKRTLEDDGTASTSMSGTLLAKRNRPEVNIVPAGKQCRHTLFLFSNVPIEYSISILYVYTDLIHPTIASRMFLYR